MSSIFRGRISRAIEADLLTLGEAGPETIVPCWAGIRACWDDAAHGSRGRCFHCGCDLTLEALCPHCGAPRRHGRK